MKEDILSCFRPGGGACIDKFFNVSFFSTALDMTSRVIFANAFFAALGNKSSMRKYDARAISNVDWNSISSPLWLAHLFTKFSA